MLTPEQLRMARAALKLSVKEAGELAGVDKGTIVRIEAGANAYIRTLKDLRDAFERAGLFFIDAKEGVHGAAVAFKWGLEPAKITKNRPTEVADDGSEALDALGWSWNEEETFSELKPAPPLSWTDEDRANQIAYWRGRPEKWVALAEASRQCLLRAMGVERL